MNEVIDDLEYVLFELERGEIYPAMKYLEEMISDLKEKIPAKFMSYLWEYNELVDELHKHYPDYPIEYLEGRFV